MRILAALTVLGLAQDPPSPEHALLRRFVGEWETKLTRPGSAPEPAGVETARLLDGGYWLTLDLRGAYEGRPYTGHGLIGYDPRKRKYVGVWVGSAAAGLSSVEGEADPSGNTLTMWIECPHPKTGEILRERMVHAFAGPGRRTLTFYGRDADGQERVTAVMTYTLRAGKSF